MIQSKLITCSEYSLDERERLHAEVRVDDSIPHVLLATCNRTETYWGEGKIPNKLAVHLFRVASGLESSLIGERAIQGQIKKAYSFALKRYKLSSSLNRLFQSAMHVGKRVRTETQIASGAISHSQVTADILRNRGIDLKNKIIAIIGVNKLTEDILKFLTVRGAMNIYLANRNYDKAMALAAIYGGTAMHLEEKRKLLSIADVLICATSAPHTIIHKSDFDDHSEMLLFDLAFPRDIDQDVSCIDGISLYNLEDIEAFARQNLMLRHGEIEKAERIIDEEIDKLNNWQQFKEAKI